MTVYKSSEAEFSEFKEVEEEASSQRGFGAFFFPQLVTIDKNNAKLQGLQKRESEAISRNVVMEHILSNGEKVVVSDDGLIVVFLKDKQEALSFLNTVLGTAITFGMQTEFLQERDVCHVKYYRQSGHVSIDSYSIQSERMTFCLLRDNPSSEQYQDWLHYPRRLLEPENCKNILDRALEYTTKPELLQDLILAFEGYTLLFREASNGAFLYGWMVVETFLAQLWDEHINSQERTQNEKAALKDFRSWTGYHHIEVFAAIGKIEPPVRDLLNKLRKKRNDIVHKRLSASRKEAASCLRVAVLIVLNRLKNPNSPFSGLEKVDLALEEKQSN